MKLNCPPDCFQIVHPDTKVCTQLIHDFIAGVGLSLAIIYATVLFSLNFRILLSTSGSEMKPC